MDETQYKTLVAFNFYNFWKEKKGGEKDKKIFFCVQNCVVSKVYSFLLCHLSKSSNFHFSYQTLLKSMGSVKKDGSHMTFLTAQ